MKRIPILTLAALLVAGTALAAPRPDGPRGAPGAGPMMHGGPGPHGPGGPHGPPGLDRNLFPPDLVLRHQIALGLTEEQIATMKRLLQEGHARMVEIQTDLARATERMAQVLEPSRVDEAAALAAGEDAMRLEAQMKKTHLSLAIRVKNLLTEEQQEKLRSLRPAPPPER